MLKILKRKYQTPWWLNLIMWSATCSLFAKHYNYTENQSDLMYHQVSEIKLDHLPKLSSHSNLNWIKRTSCHTTRTGLLGCNKRWLCVCPTQVKPLGTLGVTSPVPRGQWTWSGVSGRASSSPPVSLPPHWRGPGRPYRWAIDRHF